MQKTLPKGWKMVRLGEEVSDIIMGQSPPSSTYNTEKIGLPFYQGKAEFGEHHPKTIKWCSKPVKVAESDDILISVRAPVGDVNICEAKSCIGRGLAAIRTNKRLLDAQFLYYFLKKDANIWRKLSTGSTFDSITSKTLQILSIPLPPLSTQHKIVEILEEADDLRKLRQKADEKMKDLIPSLFVEMFGDPVTNPKRWEVKRLGDIAEIKSGGTPSRKNVEYFKGNIPWVTSVSLNKPYLTARDAKEFITEEAISNSATKLINRKSVLFGNRVCVGNVAINLCTICFSQDVLAILFQEDLLISEFLWFYLLQKKTCFERLTQGSTIKGVTVSILQNTNIFIPPFPLQQEFAERVEEIEAEKARQAESKKKLDELFNSLMQRAFTGELVT